MTLKELKSKQILIVGRGVEGKTAYKYLKKHFQNAVIDTVDQKDGDNYLDQQKNYDIAIKSPGVKRELIKIPYTTSTNIFLANKKGKVIGITGTKGKSTTSTLIYEMLKNKTENVYFGGNIGQSSLEFLDKLNEQSWIVLEMSSFQLQDLKISPYIAVVLMIGEEHLDYHKTFATYINAKRNILRFQTPSDFAIINRDYPASYESEVYTKGKVFLISREKEVTDGCFIEKDCVWVSKEGRKEKIIEIDKINLLGRHNLENVCSAVMAATIAGVSKENIVKVLKTFRGLEHRLEFVKDINGIRFYNDSLATIPRATIEALGTLPETETLIAGGHDRGLDYAPLAKYLSNGQIKTLILFPPTGIRIWGEICKVVPESKRPEKFDVKTMEQAVKIAYAKTSLGKICLLSPASASFGTFKDYKDRGDQFKREINKLIPNS